MSRCCYESRSTPRVSLRTRIYSSFIDIGNPFQTLKRWQMVGIVSGRRSLQTKNNEVRINAGKLLRQNQRIDTRESRCASNQFCGSCVKHWRPRSYSRLSPRRLKTSCEYLVMEKHRLAGLRYPG